MNAWSNPPNAKHIDWVIQSVKDNPDEWNRALDLARNAATDLARDRAWIAATDLAWDLARGAAYNAATDLARDRSWGAILTLIAYDDSAKYLDMTYEELKVWATLTEEPASILLLPMVKAKELIEAKNEQVV